MWIMIGGPYGTGAKSATDRAANLRRLNEAALAIFRRGHVPIIGVNLALPVIEAAGGDGAAEAAGKRCSARSKRLRRKPLPPLWGKVGMGVTPHDA